MNRNRSSWIGSFALVGLVFLGACASGPAEQRTASDPVSGLKNLAWISGSWSGEHDGRVIEEHWMLPRGGTMSGMARLVVNGRTVFHEFLRVVETEAGAVEYRAQPAGRCPPIVFTLTSSDARTAVFENPMHDDPKLIRYELLKDGSLRATTEGPGPDGTTRAHVTLMKPMKE